MTPPRADARRTVQLRPETHRRLEEYRRKAETMDQAVRRLMDDCRQRAEARARARRGAEED